VHLYHGPPGKYFAAIKDTLSSSLPAVFITWLFAGEKAEVTETKKDC